MRATLVPLAAGGLLCLGLSACGSSDSAGIDSKCDSAGVESEIKSIVGESTMTFDSLQSLQCSGDWSYAVAIVDMGNDTGSASATLSPFLFQKTDDVLVLKSTQLVCGTEPTSSGGDREGSLVPADLATFACP